MIKKEKIDEEKGWTIANIEHLLEMIDKQQPRFATKIIIDEETGEVASVAKVYKLPLKKDNETTK